MIKIIHCILLLIVFIIIGISIRYIIIEQTNLLVMLITIILSIFSAILIIDAIKTYL